MIPPLRVQPLTSTHCPVLTAHQLARGGGARARRSPPKPRVLPLQSGHGHPREDLPLYHILENAAQLVRAVVS